MKKLFNYFLENKVSLLVIAFISAIFVLDKNFIDILIALVSLFLLLI